MENQTFEQQITEFERTHPYVTIEHESQKIHFNIVSMVTLWRVQTLFSKEPDTMAWIAGFGTDEVFIDIGANVGMYTIWAAATRGTKVYAFEPESQNYTVLNKNIITNHLWDKVKAYCIALSDVTTFDFLNLGEIKAGGSNHTFGENVDFNLQPRKNIFQQGCFATTLDKALEDGKIQQPHYIKIDVDGIEHKVIAGMLKTLKNTKLKSVLIELNTTLTEHQNIITTMKESGLYFNQAEVNSSLALQKGGRFEGVANYIFRREGE
jgi:FkbM family methyltransferase